MADSSANETLKKMRKWQKTKAELALQTNWKVGLFFHLKPKAAEMAKFLKELGLRTVYFSNSQVLFQYLLEKRDIRMILCDWEPQKTSDSGTGTDFLINYKKFAQEKSFTQDVPIILVTFHFTGKDLMPAIRLGARDILIMPTTIDIVGEKVLANINKTVEEKSKTLQNTEPLMDKAEELIRTGNYRAAIKIYQEVIDEHGGAVDVLEKQAEAHLRAGQMDSAISCFKQCVEIEKGNARALQGLGNCYYQMGSYRQAREFFKKVVELEPENGFVDHKIGRTYMEENNMKGAERHLEIAAERNPSFFEIIEDLAMIKCDHDNADQALKILEKFLETCPEDMRGHIEYAETLIKAGKYEKAERAVREGLSQAEKDKYEPPVALYNRWGIALRKQEKYLEAIEKYGIALRIEPNNPEIHFNIAKARFESGERELVLEKFKECFEIDPSLKEEFWDDKLLSPLHEYFPKPD